MKFNLSISCLYIFLFMISCGHKEQAAKPDFLAANLDTTISPSQDFFLYANGGWIKKTTIPGAESSWGIGDLVQEEIYARLRSINEEALREKAAAGSVSQKIGDFWYSGMDTIGIEQQELKPLQEDIENINKIKNTDDVVSVAADLHTKGVGVLFGDYVGQDDKNSEKMAYQLVQGGLGMPDREYYFNTDERTLGVRNAYKKYLASTFAQLSLSTGISQADTAAFIKSADNVYNLETKLATASRKLEDLRDPYKNYNKMAASAFGKLAPNIQWPSYWSKIGIIKLDSVIVGQPEFYSVLAKELRNTNIEDWKNYLRFHLVMENATYLDKKTFDNYFQYRKTLTGATEPRPRWKRVLDAEENAMGEALGQLFVKEYFNENAKRRYTELVEAIRDVYKERILQLSWMTDSTKQKALKKLASITKKVGYPDKWKDFSALKIDRGPFVLNVTRGSQWWHNYMVSKLGKPVDRTEWQMTPQTYNAYYNSSNNEIVLPAGIFAVPGMRDEL